MEFERRLVVGRHEAQIAAILLGVGEFEIPVMQPTRTGIRSPAPLPAAILILVR